MSCIRRDFRNKSCPLPASPKYDEKNFFLYDLYAANGGVDENVFAYSNVHQDERGLVLYHNRFADTKGWIKTSAAYLDKATGDLRQKSLAEK